MQLISIATAFLVYSLLSGCSTLPASYAPAADQVIQLRRHEAKDSWVASYRLPLSSQQWLFSRNVNRFRSKNWTAKTEGLRLVDDGAHERIELDQSRKSFEFEFDSYYEYTPKDYEFFFRFSDGSLILYTGHLPVCTSGNGSNCSAGKVCYDFQGRPEDRIVVGGKLFRQNAQWCDTSGAGTYAYFGSITPVEKNRVTAVMDPGTPQWMQNRLNSDLGRLFEFYKEKTGVELSFHPVIYVSFSDDTPGYGTTGGSLPGVLQLGFQGAEWKVENSESLAKMTRFLAHESAHFWNAQMYDNDSSANWLHEGGADAFSFRAKVALGAGDSILPEHLESLNLCLGRLKDRPYNQVKEFADKKESYYCGATIFWLTELHVQKENRDLFSLWKEMFREADANQRKYTEATYFNAVKKVVADVDFANGVRDFLYGPTPQGSRAALLKLFERAGLRFEVQAGGYSKDYESSQAKVLLDLLVAEDCSGRIDLRRMKYGALIKGFSGCRTLRTDVLVTHIGSNPILEQGAQAYDEAARQCKSRSSVLLTVESATEGARREISLKCPKVFPDRLRPIQLKM